jgi:hypothetical protein
MHLKHNRPAIHAPSALSAGGIFVWVGRLAHQALIHAANSIATRFIHYDYTKPVMVEATDEGKEQDRLAFALTAHDAGPPPTARVRKAATMRRVEAYNADFELLESAVLRTSEAAGGPDPSVLYTGCAGEASICLINLLEFADATFNSTL